MKTKTIRLEIRVSSENEKDAREILESVEPTRMYPIPGDRVIAMVRYGLQHVERQRRYADEVRAARA